MQENKQIRYNLPGVSIVIVGHNEEKNLEKSFIAARAIDYPQHLIEIIFVNSMSSDNSIAIAEKYADKIVSTKNFWSTAGEAFNLGIANSSHEFIQISAGDILLDKNYLIKAILKLTSSPDIACVTGFFSEHCMNKWNRLIAYRREEQILRKPSYTNSPNGGTFKKAALIKINGYDERIKKGQETELGLRLRLAGFKIWDAQILQGTHDFDINSIGDFSKRYLNNGFSSGYVWLLSFKENNDFFFSMQRTVTKILVHFCLLISIIITLLSFGYWKYSLMFLVGFYVLNILRIVIRSKEKTFNYRKYMIVNSLFGILTFFGVVRFLFLVIFNKKYRELLSTKKRGLNDK